MDSESDLNPFKILPTEMMYNLFKKYFDFHAKLDVRLVSREWKYLMETWFFKCSAMMNDSSLQNIINNTQIRFNQLTVQDLKVQVELEDFQNKSLNVKNIHFLPSTMGSLYASISQSNFENLLLLCEDSLEALTFKKGSLNTFRCFRPTENVNSSSLKPYEEKNKIPTVYYPKLSKIEIEVAYQNSNDIVKLLDSLERYMEMPALSTITIIFIEICCFDWELVQTRLYQFIENHKFSLKTLNLRVSFHWRHNYDFHRCRYSKATMHEQLDCLRNKFKIFSLENLVIECVDGARHATGAADNNMPTICTSESLPCGCGCGGLLSSPFNPFSHK